QTPHRSTVDPYTPEAATEPSIPRTASESVPLHLGVASRRLFDRGAMNRDGICNVACVSPRQSHDHRDASRLNGVEHRAVTASKTVHRQTKTAKLVVFVGISAGQIENNLGFVRHPHRKRTFELAKVCSVVHAVGQTDVERAARLPQGV